MGGMRLTCARYASSHQKLEGGHAADPAVAVILDVMVFLEQAVVVIVIVINIVILRAARSAVVRYLLKLDSRRTINEVVWGFVFCAEADIAWRG